MILTNILLGIIIFLLVIMFGAVMNIEKTLKNIEFKRLKGVYDGLGLVRKKVKDEEER